MRSTLLALTLFLSIITTVQANELQVHRDGLVIMVVDFKEGDKIKLFEVESGDHILSKSIGQIDLSQLPIGKYVLENNTGNSIVIERTDSDIHIEKSLGTQFIVEKNSQRAMISTPTNLEKELEDYYTTMDAELLTIHREGSIITVMDFEEGDEIKLFELRNTVHVLSKTTNAIDLSQLVSGKYLLESDNGKAVIIEKLEEEEYTEDI